MSLHLVKSSLLQHCYTPRYVVAYRIPRWIRKEIDLQVMNLLDCSLVDVFKEYEILTIPAHLTRLSRNIPRTSCLSTGFDSSSIIRNCFCDAVYNAKGLEAKYASTQAHGR